MNALELLTLTKEQKGGIWLSGIEEEGEYKEWWGNGKLIEYFQWKNGSKHGEYKWWSSMGKLRSHGLFENDIMTKDFLK